MFIAISESISHITLLLVAVLDCLRVLQVARSRVAGAASREGQLNGRKPRPRRAAPSLPAAPRSVVTTHASAQPPRHDNPRAPSARVFWEITWEAEISAKIYRDKEPSSHS
ncbi:hypothetical protein MSG28_006629 [Choristoneura fumiferana]|uniref:Uncharacterized protein n=1 Tax=Choristoneura fumiferana TaxID=7141 RepID=A0ACC0JKI8_CHOFU|nr:hypothetical protein MSG28_006629 [Choristoneura fumiferana]